MIFHKSGPLAGQARGYAFVTYTNRASATIALTKVHGQQIGSKNIVVRLAKNINYDDADKPRSKVEIPALAVGTSNNGRLSKESTIKAIEAKLKALESNADDLVINQGTDNGIPLIQRYQYNKDANTSGASSSNARKFHSRPYQRNQRRPRR